MIQIYTLLCSSCTFVACGAAMSNHWYLRFYILQFSFYIDVRVVNISLTTNPCCVRAMKIFSSSIPHFSLESFLILLSKSSKARYAFLDSFSSFSNISASPKALRLNSSNACFQYFTSRFFFCKCHNFAFLPSVT